MIASLPTPQLVTPSGEEVHAINIVRPNPAGAMLPYEIRKVLATSPGDSQQPWETLLRCREQVWSSGDDGQLWRALRWWVSTHGEGPGSRKERPPLTFALIPLGNACVLEAVGLNLDRGVRLLLPWSELRSWVLAQSENNQRMVTLGVDTASLFPLPGIASTTRAGEVLGNARGHERLRQELKQISDWEGDPGLGAYVVYFARSFWAFRQLKADDSKLRYSNPLVVLAPDKQSRFTALWGDTELEEAAASAGLRSDTANTVLARHPRLVELASKRLRPLGLFSAGTRALLQQLLNPDDGPATFDEPSSIAEAARRWAPHEAHIEALICSRVLWEFSMEHEVPVSPLLGPPWYRRYHHVQVSPFFRSLYTLD
jgi:hypothetical protein